MWVASKLAQAARMADVSLIWPVRMSGVAGTSGFLRSSHEYKTNPHRRTYNNTCAGGLWKVSNWTEAESGTDFRCASDND